VTRIQRISDVIAEINISFPEKNVSLVIYHATFTRRDAVMNDANWQQQQQQQQHASLILLSFTERRHPLIISHRSAMKTTDWCIFDTYQASASA